LAHQDLTPVPRSFCEGGGLPTTRVMQELQQGQTGGEILCSPGRPGRIARGRLARRRKLLRPTPKAQVKTWPSCPTGWAPTAPTRPSFPRSTASAPPGT